MVSPPPPYGVHTQSLIPVDSPVKYSDMQSGIWTIVIQAEAADFAVQRRFTLQSGVPERTAVTVRPSCIHPLA